MAEWSSHTTIRQGRASTIDCQDYSTMQAECKRRQHLQREDRGALQHLKPLGYSNRAIAREIGRAPATIADFAQVAQWCAKIYFAHPYTSWERPQNERHNGLFRQYVPKGVSTEQFSDEEVLAFADELNGRPRRKLGYRTPEELFGAFLDKLYAA
jgi:IS30 family transposase